VIVGTVAGVVVAVEDGHVAEIGVATEARRHANFGDLRWRWL
jgi:hypothetical protein